MSVQVEPTTVMSMLHVQIQLVRLHALVTLVSVAMVTLAQTQMSVKRGLISVSPIRCAETLQVAIHVPVCQALREMAKVYVLTLTNVLGTRTFVKTMQYVRTVSEVTIACVSRDTG